MDYFLWNYVWKQIRKGLLFKARPRNTLLFEAGLGNILLFLNLCLETDFVRFGNGLLFWSCILKQITFCEARLGNGLLFLKPDVENY